MYCRWLLADFMLFLMAYTRAQGPDPVPVITGDCDHCIIINGIGYKDLNPCWQYLQCYFDEGGNVARAEVRTTAWGTFWNQFHINQDYPSQTECQFDMCTGQPAGYQYSRPDNCRGYWECGPNGRTSHLRCCDSDSRFDEQSRSCMRDSADICTDACPPILPTSAGPLPCPYAIRPDSAGRRFYSELYPNAEDMTCAETQVFDPLLCTCINLIHDGCVPEFWLDFRDREIKDVSRNRYYIDVRGGVEVRNDNNDNNNNDDYYGVFNKASETQLIVNGMASTDPGYKFVVYVRYRRNVSQNLPSGSRRPTLVSDSDCHPLDYSYAAFINPSSNGGVVAGWLRGESGQQERQNSDEDNAGINVYIMEYNGDVDGETLTLSLNGITATATNTDGPKGRKRENSGALHIGYGHEEHNLDYFTGDIYEVRIYKCIPETYGAQMSGGLQTN